MMHSLRAAAAVSVAAVAVFALSACGSEAAPSSDPAPVMSANRPAARLKAPPVQAPSAEPTVAEVIRLGVEQPIRVGGQVVGRIVVRSFDPADGGVAVEVNGGAAPFVVDPAAFVLVDASGAEFVGVASNPAWDVELAASDQTVGQVRFAGATVPVTLTYSPAGGEPLVWSF